MVQFSVIFPIFYYLLVGCSARGEDPIIKTPQGVIQGYYKNSFGGRTFTAFEGIPYAKPPIGDLRFAEPEPAGKWKGRLMANHTYNCLSYLPFPPIKGVLGSEDCLYAYVYVPLKNIKGDENLDVVVHIHGGGFMFGSPSFMCGPDYIMDKDVVFVSFNYRLAILGFLSTEDNEVSGNNGLKDQVMALKWIQENIKYFGGNPNSVTLTGLSAGGASVHYHYLSPLSKGLFHRGFSQSGTVLSPWAVIENPLTKAKQVATHLNCPTDSTKTMVQCLRNTDARNLLAAMAKLFIYFDAVPFIIFGPVIEKGETPFLDDHPYKLLKEGKVYDVPWITSNVKDEGIFPTALFVMGHLLPEIDTKWNEIMPFMLDVYDTVDEGDKLSVVKAIRKYYYEDDPVGEDNIYSMVKLFSDRFFFIGSETAIRLQSQATKSPVYYYLLTYLLANPILPIFGMKRGVSHGDDGGLLFKFITAGPIMDRTDEEMMKLFTEFIAIYANTSIPSINHIEWVPVESGNTFINALKIESPNEIAMIKMDKIGSREFWSSLPIKENDKLFPELR